MTVKQIQQVLVALGYNPGTIDGVNGSQTRLAVKSFQVDYNKDAKIKLVTDSLAGEKTQVAMCDWLLAGKTKPSSVTQVVNSVSKPSTPFTPRLTRPESGNKYYITQSAGGYSSAIVGSPPDPRCNVLSNCVGYAKGRFNEIIGKWTYDLFGDAEDFWNNCGSLQKGQLPKQGAIMVWRKGATFDNSDGAGHVCIVELVHDNYTVTTSESAYNGTAFYTMKRYKSDGNWGMGSSYHFLGFIYNPAVK